MTTVVIWDECEADVKFFVVEGDYSHLDRQYINSCGTTNEQVDELNALVFNKDGSTKVEMLGVFPVNAVKAGAHVVVMGFLP